MNIQVLSLPENGPLTKRIEEIKELFVTQFGISPEFYARAPGRVNLIGEHIDYCGYAVCPMAIEQNILAAVAKREDRKLCISNTDPQYENYECDIDTYELTDIKHKWYKYILCGFQGVKDEGRLSQSLTGISVLINGSIPRAAGLSSSSALVCVAALVLSYCFNADISLHALAELCARSERYIGTEGGGMDQAASLLSNTGFAQLMEFNPLRCTPVSLPDGAMFVVANSLVEKNKAAGSDYNTRVVECRLACRIIAKNSNLPIKGNIQLGELQKTLSRNFSEMVELVKEFLHPQPYSKQEVCQLLNMSVSQLEKEVLSANTVHLTEFELYKRALHVFTEASRVWEFKHICDNWNTGSALVSNEEKVKVLQRLGQLMEESHSSAQYLYECSHPQLDKLVEISKGVAYGARLTGAGWGGCIVALVDQTKVEEYLDLIKRKYYSANGFKIDDWSSVLFSTEPSSGAQIYTPTTSATNGLA